MDNNELKHLIQKYYKGDTSRDEEQKIHTWLAENQKNNSFTFEKAQFEYFAKERKKKTSSQFDQNFENLLNQKKTIAVVKRWSVGIAAVLILSFMVFLYENRNIAEIEKNEWVNIYTSPDERKEINLPDGSKISLNKASHIRYAKEFIQTERKVFLEGEAFFEVHKNPKKTFIVHTRNSFTEVLGTSFNIKDNLKQSKVEVIVFTGKVSFSTLKNNLQEKVFLDPGDKAVFNIQGNSIKKVENIDPNAIAWKTKKLIFENSSMANVLSTLSNYFEVNIYSKNKQFLKCNFQGSFTDATLEQVLEVLAFSMDVSYKKTTDGYEISGKECL